MAMASRKEAIGNGRGRKAMHEDIEEDEQRRLRYVARGRKMSKKVLGKRPRADSFLVVDEKNFDEKVRRLVEKYSGGKSSSAATQSDIGKQLEILTTAIGRLCSPSQIYVPNQLGLQIKLDALVDENVVPRSLCGDEAEDIWPFEAWPWLKKANQRPTELQFRKSIESIRVQNCKFTVSFTGGKYDNEAGLNKFGDFCVHLKNRDVFPCYIAAIFSLYSKTAGKYNSKSEVGEIAIRAMKLLRSAGPSRLMVIAGVTDGRKIEWVRLEVSGEGGHRYVRTGEHDDLRESLCALLRCHPNQLYLSQTPDLRVKRKVVFFECFLGAGTTSNVYRCKYNGKDVVAKCFLVNYSAVKDDEYLRRLAGIEGVPNLVATSDDYKTILMSPIGERIDKAKVSKETKQRVSCIVDILHSAHQRGVIHRDVRVCNILLVNDAFQLIDWGFAANSGISTLFSGNVTTASDDLLLQLASSKDGMVRVGPADDLISLVRSLYIFSHHDAEKNLDPLKRDYQAVRNFWSTELEGCVPWIKAQELARNINYEKLKLWIEKWAKNYWP